MARSPTILVVEDDATVIRVLSRVLNRMGYLVLEASTAARALRQAEAERPDLALLDLRLPDGDGVELAAALDARHPGLPVILMTGCPLRLRERPELARRFAAVLAKPVGLPELRQALEAARRAPLFPPTNPDMHTQPPPAPEPSPSPAAPAPTAAASPGRRHTLQSVAVVIAALLVLVGVVVFILGIRPPWQAEEVELTEKAPPPLGVELASAGGRPHTLVVPPEVRAALGVRRKGVDLLAAPRRPDAARPLVLPGSTMFDPSQVRRIRVRFAPAEVVRVGPIGTAPVPSFGTRVEPREFRAGDEVGTDDVLAELYSPDVGNKKNDLYEAVVQQRLDEVILTMAEKASGSLPPVTLWTYRRNVEVDRSASRRAENMLKTWDIPQKDIDAVKKEAQEVPILEGRLPKEDPAAEAERLKRWGLVLIKSPFTGDDGARRNPPVIVERNLGDKELVIDNTQNLFVLARVDRLTVVVNAPEDLLPELNELQGRARRWTIHTAADGGAGIEAPFDDISFLVDQNQHSLVIKGRIDNPGRLLRGGLYVTATIRLPPPRDVVEVPVPAVVDDGKQSVVFVRDPRDPDRFTMRRVQVTHRFPDVVYVRSKPFGPKEALTEAEAAEGLPPREPLTEQDRVLLSGVLELKKELEDREANAEAEKR
jgi:cobalt-zinc-cadmium efflux system membrane fusion protein